MAFLAANWLCPQDSFRGNIVRLQTATPSSRRALPFIAGGFLLLAGGLTIVGWEIGSTFLKDPFSTSFMAPNTALCLIVGGLALIVQQWEHWFWRVLGYALGAFLALAGLLTLGEYLTRADFGIDRLFLASKLNQWTWPNVLPGRFAPNTAVAFSFAGLAVIFSRRRAGFFRLAELFALPVFFLSFLSIVGYAYRAEPLYGFSSYSAMALQTAFCLGVLSLGLLWPNSDHGVMALVLSNNAGGVAARRLLVATLITLPVLGWLRLKTQGHDVQFGTAVLIIVSVVVFAFLIIRTAYILRELDTKRRQAEESLMRSHAELETLVDQRTTALRHLSTRLMQLQDDERRRIARELHDSLGQYLSALGINLGRLEQGSTDPRVVLTESRELLNRTISEMRTLSHLLHPPLLDEVGFASAAKWYVEEFAKRSGIQATVDLPEILPRLPEFVEIGLFRVLQEGLTNIHRHSGSSRAEIHLETEPGKLCMDIIDYGNGIPTQVLERWRRTGTAGVGLTGMRERIRELGGDIEISSTGSGTLVRVTVPVADAASIRVENAAQARAAK